MPISYEAVCDIIFISGICIGFACICTKHACKYIQMPMPEHNHRALDILPKYAELYQAPRNQPSDNPPPYIVVVTQ